MYINIILVLLTSSLMLNAPMLNADYPLKDSDKLLDVENGESNVIADDWLQISKGKPDNLKPPTDPKNEKKDKSAEDEKNLKKKVINVIEKIATIDLLKNDLKSPVLTKDQEKDEAESLSEEKRKEEEKRLEQRLNNIKWGKWDLKKTKSFQFWDIVVRRVGTTKFTCHAVSKPLRSDIYVGIRLQPYLIIHHFGYERFTISGSSGFDINPNMMLSIYTNNLYYKLGVEREFFYKGDNRNNDINIINSMRIDSDNMAMVYSADVTGNTVIDYYSLLGLKESLDYMNNYCQQ